MITRFYADVMPDGVIRGVFKINDPDEGPPAPPNCEGECQPLGADFVWAQPSDTSRAIWHDGALAWEETLALVDAVTAALDQIDAAAEAVRQAAVAKRTLKADEYSQAETQAKEWKAANYQGDAPQDVVSWANAKWRDLMTPQQAAEDILNQAMQYRTLLSHIRALRLTDMENVRHATSNAEVSAIVAQFQKDLESLSAP